MHHLLRAQSSIEFIIVVGLVVLLVTIIMLPGMRESEISVALSSARMAAFEFAQEKSLSFTSVCFTSQGGTVTIKPVVSDILPEQNAELNRRILTRIRDAFAPSAQVSEESFRAPNYVYKVQVQSSDAQCN